MELGEGNRQAIPWDRFLPFPADYVKTQPFAISCYFWSEVFFDLSYVNVAL